VVGRKSEQWGEEIVAFVVPVADKTVSSGKLDQHCLDNIARFKRPKDHFLLKELPKNNYGKILKRTLRKQVNS
jgi:long-chain acyl-CoA synthetase